jgi:malonyl-CoA decarboxylase
MTVSFLQELLTSVAEQGRQLLPRSLWGPGREDDIAELADALGSNRGEASGVAIASELLRRYRVPQVPGPHDAARSGRGDPSR